MSSIEQINNVLSIIGSVVKPEPIDDNSMLIEVLRLASAMGQPDVAEVYSPPRIVPEGTKNCLKPVFSLDLTVNRPDGNPWTSSIKRHRDEVVQLVLELEPCMIIGSPPCTLFSILQNGHRHRLHINLGLTLYELQRRG